MTREEIITDLNDKLAIAVTGYDAKPTAETANEIKFLYRRLKFYEGKWPEIYEQWNVSNPPADADASSDTWEAQLSDAGFGSAGVM